MKRVAIILLMTALLSPILKAQVNLDYQKPPAEILELVDVPLAPAVLLDNMQEHMLLLYRDAFNSIDELSKKEMRLTITVSTAEAFDRLQTFAVG